MTRTPFPRTFSVCADSADKYVLQLVDAPLKWLTPEDAAHEDADIVLFQASQNLGFVPRAGALHDRVWRRAREGDGRVVFDASMEGKPHTPEAAAQLHDLLDKARVPASNAVYITQDRQYAADYAAWLASHGLKTGIKVVVYDYWIRRTLAAHLHTGAGAFERRLQAFQARRTSRERRFLSLNFTPRPTRLHVLLRLMRDGLWDQGFISFGGFDQMMRRRGKSLASIRREFLRFPGFEDEAAAVEPLLEELVRRGQFLMGRLPAKGSKYGTVVQDQALPEYGESWFSIVTETEMGERPCRITEKPLKPLLNFHPFVIFGNPGALKLIRDLGFVTFPELFDERYDEEPDPRRRFDMAFEQVRRLCAAEEGELARMAAAASEKLISNAEFGLTRLPAIFSDQTDVAMMREVLGLA
jgi:hypothetical protein